MTVIAITKFRPHHRKANLVLQNMKDVVSEFDKMGMTARISSKGTERCRTGRPSSRLAVYSCIEYSPFNNSKKPIEPAFLNSLISLNCCEEKKR